MRLLRFGPSSENDPFVLWIHGLGESSACFESIVEKLPGYRHLLLDLPGYGKAERHAPYSLKEAAEMVAQVLREQGGGFVVGHSMGGVIGIFLAQAYPKLVRGFVNVDGNVSPGDCGYSLPISRQSEEEFVGRGHGALVESLRLRGGTDLAHAGYAQSMELAQPSVVYGHSLELVEYSASLSLARQMADLVVPNIYLAGVPEGAAEASLALLAEAGVRLFKVGPSGHWPFIDQPQQVAEVVLDFFGGIA